jgi:aryl-alcohol dehydrogenase-like predicted oxidoreductase
MSGDVWGVKDDAESLRAIHTALDAGVNIIDTAAEYGNGHAERLVGRALKARGNREDIIVSTKVLPKCGVFAPPPEMDIDDFYPPEWITAQCEASLSRLGLDRIGILFAHTWSRSWAHRTEWYEAMLRLKEQGKIRAFGISITDEGVADANAHIAAGRVEVVQCVYNIFQQEPEYTLFPLARRHKVGVIARSPFSSGALVGNWSAETSFPEGDWRGLWPPSVKDNWLGEQVEMAEHVRSALNGWSGPMASAALKYILTSPDVSSVIPGSANPKHVTANLNVPKDPDFPPQVVTGLKQLWRDRKIHGTYNGSI